MVYRVLLLAEVRTAAIYYHCCMFFTLFWIKCWIFVRCQKTGTPNPVKETWVDMNSRIQTKNELNRTEISIVTEKDLR